MNKLNFYNGKKVFITGHTGFKGSWLSRILINAGADVAGYSLAPASDAELYNLLRLDESIASILGDVRNLNSLKRALADFQPDIVLHLAAQPIVRVSYTDPVGTYSTNVMGTVNVLEACRDISSLRSVVNVTTDKVYENKEWHWGYRENENLCGYDPYSNSKSCSELVTYSYTKCFYDYTEAPSVSTARSGNVIGGGDFSTDRIIPDCVRAASAGTDISVRNPLSTRPYQHVLECLSGYLLLAEKQYNDSSYAGCYNFGPDDLSCVNTGELVDKFCNLWSGIKRVDAHDGGPHEANFLKLDCSKAKTVLNWRPHWDIDTALSQTVEWYKVWARGEDVRAVTDKQIKEYFNE